MPSVTVLMPRAGAALALALAVSLVPPVARAADDGCSGDPEGPAALRFATAARMLAAGDTSGVKVEMDALVSEAGADPVVRLEAGAWLERAGDEDGAKKQYAAALEQLREGAAPTEEHARQARAIYEAAALLRLDRIDEAKQAMAALRKDEGALAAHACRWTLIANAFAARRDLDQAMRLLEDVREVAPQARSVHDALAELAWRDDDPARMQRILEEALKQFPDDVEFTVRLANAMKIQGERDRARGTLERLLVAGEASPSLLGELLGLVSGKDQARDALDRYTAWATEKPDLPALALMVGVMHHYLGAFAESNTWLERAAPLADKEPRVAMYTAMNHFRLGDQAKAEEAIERAMKASRVDPDVSYCRAVIYVRSRPDQALADLQRYFDQTSGRPDVEPSKQERVKQTLELLQGCVNGDDPKACVEKEVVEKAAALAFEEHFKAEGAAAEGEAAPAGEGGGEAAPAGEGAAAPAGEGGGEPAPGSAERPPDLDSEPGAGAPGASGGGDPSGPGGEGADGGEPARDPNPWKDRPGTNVFYILLGVLAAVAVALGLRALRRRREGSGPA